MSDLQPDAGQPRPSDLSAVSRLAAGNGLREAMKNKAGLEPVARAAATFVCGHFGADACAISLLKDDWFQTLVTVGEREPGQLRHNDGATYSANTYPTVTATLRDGRGYLASLGNDGGIPESQRFLKQFRKSTCMGVPIAYQGDTVGELWVSRVSGRPHFTGHDLAALHDIARQIGYRLGPAVKAKDAVDPEWWPGTLREDGRRPGTILDAAPGPAVAAATDHGALMSTSPH